LSIMGRDRSTLPAWVLHKGEITPVIAFEGIKPKDRPVVQCPGCQEDVIMKIGKINPAHYAHMPGSWCSETALHLNTKMNLVKLLSKVDKLSYRVACKDRCGSVRDKLIISGWDEVRAEFILGDIRPDIALLKGGEAIACIEITHTHGIGPGKWDYLQKLNLPTIELKASEYLSTWEHANVIPASSIVSSFLIEGMPIYFQCDTCREKREANKAPRETIEVPPSPTHPPGSRIVTLAACCWDIYMVNGHRYRESFQARAEIVDGIHLRKWIENKKEATVCSVDNPDDESSIILDQKLKEHMQKIIPKQRLDFIDHRQSWKKVNPKYSHLETRDHCRRRYKYRMDLKTQSWVEN
jgi:hypothetical protein